MASVTTTRTLTSVLDLLGVLLLIASVSAMVGLSVSAIFGGWWGVPLSMLSGGAGLLGLSGVLISLDIEAEK